MLEGLHHELGVPVSVGILDTIRGSRSVEDVMREVDISQLRGGPRHDTDPEPTRSSRAMLS